MLLATLVVSNLANENIPYELNGKDWEEGVCGKGKEQSPINVVTADVLPDPAFQVFAIFNNQTIEAEFADELATVKVYGKWLRMFIRTVDGTTREYEAKQLHFHAPC